MGQFTVDVVEGRPQVGRAQLNAGRTCRVGFPQDKHVSVNTSVLMDASSQHLELALII